jgi:hypothetical protein
MKIVEKFLSPLIEQQFPEFYRTDGPALIAFVKAYYEWLENNTQELVLEDDTGFEIGDLIFQGDSREGKIISKFNGRYLVELTTKEEFKCNRLCNDLTILRGESGGSTFILQQRRYNVEYIARNLSEFRDIDKTIDRFIINFKNKYLADIQFTTASNKQLFVKNALNFYRAKGTERAIDLFFKLIYGFEARVYYPGDDIFKPSDNEWVDVSYVEIEQSDTNVEFVGQLIRGIKSNATAFVERLVRIKKDSRFISVLYLANIEGTFLTGETIVTTNLSTNITSRVIGSLTRFEIISSNTDFKLGQVVEVVDGQGRSAKARVTGIIDKVGTVDFELLSGGWGYTQDAQIFSSERVYEFNDIKIANTSPYNLNEPFNLFETIRQDLISFVVDESNTFFNTNTMIIGIDSSNNQTFEGKVVSINPDDNTVVVNYDKNTTNTNIIIDTDILYSNTQMLSIDVLSINNSISATGNVFAFGDDVTFTYTGPSDAAIGDVLYQVNDFGQIFCSLEVLNVYTNQILNEKYFDVIRSDGIFRTNRTLINSRNNSQYTIVKAANVSVGLIEASNIFYPLANTYGENTGTFGTGVSFSFDNEASFQIIDYSNQQTITDFYSPSIIDISSNTVIESNTYDYSANSSFGFDDIISDVVPFEDVTIASINSIVVRNPGKGYPTNPFYRIFDRKSFHMERYDFIIRYTEDQRTFREGEIIIGLTNLGKAQIVKHIATEKTLIATRISIANNLSTDEDIVEGESIRGETTGIVATVEYINENRIKPRTGYNANIRSDSLSGSGFVTSLQVIDSGFGYFEDEIVALVTTDELRKNITAFVKLGEYGIGTGYHTSNKSFLSSDKYLHDNDFYQEYSYAVLTSLPFQVYKQTLIDVLHVAGTKPFGFYYGTEESTLQVNSETQTKVYLTPPKIS